MGQEHLAHSARAQRREDAVSAERASDEGVGRLLWFGRGDGGRLQEAAGGLVRRDQRLDLALEGRIAPAHAAEEGGPLLPARTRERAVQDGPDALPAFRGQGRGSPGL